MIIVGLGHKSRQGKDEFANFLTTYLRVNTRNKKILKVGFADQLKDICHTLYSWTGVQDSFFYEKNPKERHTPLNYFKGETVVDLWIKFGNHLRTLDENIWINALLKTQNVDVLIIKDLRFPNEFKAIKENKGITCKIERPEYEGLSSVSDNALNTETDWDTIIYNSKGLDHLYSLAEQFAIKYIIPKLE